MDEELDYVLGVLKESFELQDRGRLGSGANDAKEVQMLGRKVRWHEKGGSFGKETSDTGRS